MSPQKGSAETIGSAAGEGFPLRVPLLGSFFGAPYPTRSAIVRLESGDLWVWSPVKLTADLRAEVDRLGPVRHLVSPNKLHHLYLSEWKDAFPDAQLWGPRSTIRKRPELEFREALQDDPPSEWRPDIDQAWFRGSFAMDEIVFLHRPSATAIVADLIQTFGDAFLRKHWGWYGFLARLDGLTRESSLRAAGVAVVVHQPRPRASGSRGPLCGGHGVRCRLGPLVSENAL